MTDSQHVILSAPSVRAAALAAIAIAFAVGCSEPVSNQGADIGGSDTTAAQDSAGTTDAVSSDGTVDGVNVEDSSTDSVDAESDAATDAADAASDADTSVADTEIADTAHPSDTSGDVSGDTSKDASDGFGGPGTCAGNCGKYSSSASCQCDAACVDFGDCCADFKQLCECNADSDCAAPGDLCKTGACNFGICSVTAKDCNDGNDCTDDACDPANGACKATPLAEGKLCSGSGCVDGACSAGTCKPASNKTDGTKCSDADACTSGDACLSGACVGATKADCDDDDTCTIDSCDPKKGCSYAPGNEGQTCNDGQDCTADDKCSNGSCEGTDKADATPCDDGDSCTYDDACSKGYCDGKASADNTPCDDGNACTSGDQCFFGFCSGGTKNCSDGVPCTDDLCDKATGACDNKQKADGATCSDSEDCTTGDACTSGTCVGTPKADGASCTDGVACTVSDACSGAVCAGKADPSKAGSFCTDGDGCTSSDACDDKGQCIGKPSDGCNDGDPCTLDLCDNVQGVGKCSHSPIQAGATCEDGDACTLGETCDGSGKCAGGTDKCGAPVWSDTFACGQDKGWTFSPLVSNTGWAIDDKPSTPKAYSDLCSLNFNNGKDFNAGSSVKGNATSPAVALPANASVTVVEFWSYNGVETSNSYDQRYVEVATDADFKTIIATSKLDNTKSTNTWAKVTLGAKAGGAKSLWLRFRFDTVDSVNNSTAGWFVDDVLIKVVTP